MVSDAEEPKRRWVVPPALYREAGEHLDGVEFLEENPPALGVVLWEAFRDVTLWAECDPADRAALFADDAAAKRDRAIMSAQVPPELAPALQPLTALLTDPGSAPATIIASACAAISAWATGHAARRTALAFAQASARAEPTDPRAALHVGNLARELGRYLRAGSWYRRVIGLARRAKDWRSYTEAHLGLAEIALAQNNVEVARRYVTKVMRASRRHAVQGLTADALRILYHLAERDEDETAMHQLARRVLRAYGRGNPQQIPFLFDLARSWLNRAATDRAAPILDRLEGRLTDPADVAVADALRARVAAARGQRPIFDDAWARAWAFLRDRDDDPLTTTVLRDLSAAAGGMGDWHRMGQAVARAGGQRERGSHGTP